MRAAFSRLGFLGKVIAWLALYGAAGYAEPAGLRVGLSIPLVVIGVCAIAPLAKELIVSSHRLDGAGARGVPNSLERAAWLLVAVVTLLVVANRMLASEEPRPRYLLAPLLIAIAYVCSIASGALFARVLGRLRFGRIAAFVLFLGFLLYGLGGLVADDLDTVAGPMRYLLAALTLVAAVQFAILPEAVAARRVPRSARVRPLRRMPKMRTRRQPAGPPDGSLEP